MDSTEQRRTTRFPVMPEREAAVLRVGRRSIEGRLINESSGGFGVRVEAEAPIAAGQVLLLGSASGWCRVRVTHAKADEEGAYVGLERLADLPPDWEGGSRLSWWPFEGLRIAAPGGDRSAYIMGIMLVFGLIFGGTLWHVMSDGAGPQLTLWAPDRTTLRRYAPSGQGGVARTTARPTAAPAPTASPVVVRERRTPTAARATQSAFERSLARWTDGAAQWAGGMRRAVVTTLPSPEATVRNSGRRIEQWASQAQRTWQQVRDDVILLLPQVENELQLSDDQRAQIQKISRDSRENVQKVYRDAPDKNSREVWQEIERVRREASEQALAQLTPQQQERLLALRTH